jgi:demethylmenaquinone methyltransferase/2-methoxy-6-polyprenyl-1,4-benzoquinol methylase
MKKTDFGFQDVYDHDKPGLVRDLFGEVSSKYDLMNDLMSFGLHRLWKSHFIHKIPASPHMKLLDVAGGTGDIALRFLKENRALNPEVVVLDLTPEMIQAGKDKAYNNNITKGITWQCGMAEDLPFDDNTFDAYTISFGLRNVTDKEKALQEAYRVLKPGAPFFCLEFSKVKGPSATLYNLYAMKGIPLLGKMIAHNEEAYQYLSESIERFWGSEMLLNRIKDAGFVSAYNEKMCKGLVAIHVGYKPK